MLLQPHLLLSGQVLCVRGRVPIALEVEVGLAHWHLVRKAHELSHKFGVGARLVLLLQKVLQLSLLLLIHLEVVCLLVYELLVGLGAELVLRIVQHHVIVALLKV